jgi:hypothetical protein
MIDRLPELLNVIVFILRLLRFRVNNLLQVILWKEKNIRIVMMMGKESINNLFKKYNQSDQ